MSLKYLFNYSILNIAGIWNLIYLDFVFDEKIVTKYLS